MKQFECRCIKHTSSFHGALINLVENKIYLCEHLHQLEPGFGLFRIRVYDGRTFIWFTDDEEFSQYFDYTKYLRKKKLEKLNLAISAKKIKI